MRLTKTKLSVSISPRLAQVLQESAEKTHESKSAVVEQALQNLFEERMAQDSKKLASLSFDDLPSEDEWLKLQSGY